MKKHCHGRRYSQVNASCGFALAETIIALLILSIALLAIAIVPIMSSKMAIQTTQRERAMSIAYAKLDELEAVQFSSASNDVFTQGEFTGTVSYQNQTDGSKIASITVSWSGVGGNSEFNLSRRLSEAAYKVVDK